MERASGSKSSSQDNNGQDVANTVPQPSLSLDQSTDPSGEGLELEPSLALALGMPPGNNTIHQGMFYGTPQASIALSLANQILETQENIILSALEKETSTATREEAKKDDALMAYNEALMKALVGSAEEPKEVESTVLEVAKKDAEELGEKVPLVVEERVASATEEEMEVGTEIERVEEVKVSPVIEDVMKKGVAVESVIAEKEIEESGGKVPLVVEERVASATEEEMEVGTEVERVEEVKIAAVVEDSMEEEVALEKEEMEIVLEVLEEEIAILIAKVIAEEEMGKVEKELEEVALLKEKEEMELLAEELLGEVVEEGVAVGVAVALIEKRIEEAALAAQMKEVEMEIESVIAEGVARVEEAERAARAKVEKAITEEEASIEDTIKRVMASETRITTTATDELSNHQSSLTEAIESELDTQVQLLVNLLELQLQSTYLEEIKEQETLVAESRDKVSSLLLHMEYKTALVMVQKIIKARSESISLIDKEQKLQDQLKDNAGKDYTKLKESKNRECRLVNTLSVYNDYISSLFELMVRKTSAVVSQEDTALEISSESSTSYNLDGTSSLVTISTTIPEVDMPSTSAVRHTRHRGQHIRPDILKAIERSLAGEESDSD
ncbi:hypothetical protein [Candidatus Ichthyocystis sparus]|uniref:hypothetical protein n=1 Tax=Candidatus Ichthyocystis sparus TaxID=1561004 RepID=UPI00114762D0|nr:hypothetical protein [Candidatus Ichthyocystis sparus]